MIWIFFPFLLFAGVIENNISQVYKNYYKNINISKIVLNKNKNSRISYIDTSMINPKRNQGTVKVDDKYLFFKIIATVKVLKSTQTIKKGDLLTHQNTALIEEKFKNFYNKPVMNYVNKSSKMYIPQNKVIYFYMLSKPNVIKRGQRITIISQSGGIEITFQAIAMQNGEIGDKIKVRKDKQIFFVTIDKNGNGRL